MANVGDRDGIDELAEEMSSADAQQLQLVFLGLHLVLALGTLAVAAYAGFKAWTWWIAIPLVGTANLALRILRDFIRNLLDRVQSRHRAREAIERLDAPSAPMTLARRIAEYTPSAEDIEQETALYSGQRADDIESARKTRSWLASPTGLVLSGGVFVLFYGALWYGVGTLLRIIL